jgi:hypothetical protein
MQNWCAEIKIRAERRAGELLQEMDEREERHPGGHFGLHAATQKPTLADLGIDKTQSHRYQTIASLPAPAFEAHIARSNCTVDRLRLHGTIITLARAEHPHLGPNLAKGDFLAK